MAANTNTAPTRVVGGSTAGKLTIDNVYVRALDILQNPKIGSLRNMMARYVIQGGKAIFKTPERLIPSSYTALGGNKSQYGVVPQIEIPVDQAEVFKHPIEVLDFATQALAEEEESRLAGSIVQGIDAQLDAEFLTGLIATAGAAKFADIKTPGITVGTTPEDIQKLWRTISFEANLLKSKVTKNTLGVDNGQLVVITSYNLLTVLVEYLKVYTTKTVEMAMEGSETQMLRIGNINILPHPFLGNTFPAGSLHESKAYDFKGVDCMIFHSEAYAGIMNVAPRFWNTTDPDTGNVVIGCKYQYGKGALRPNFISNIATYPAGTDLKTVSAYDTGEVISADLPNKKPNTPNS